MALIKCPNCEKEISDSVGYCIHCKEKITICPECNVIYAGHIDSCKNCGYIFNIDSQTNDDSNLNNGGTTKTNSEKSELKDLQTNVIEYIVYNDEYKLFKKIFQVLYFILIAIPLTVLLPLFEVAYVALVKSTGSFKLASLGMELIFELKSDLFDLLKSLIYTVIPESEFTFYSFLGIISLLICVIINGMFCYVIYDLIHKSILHSKLNNMVYNNAKTISRLYTYYYREDLTEEELDANNNIWDFVFQKNDSVERVTIVYKKILSFIRILMPLIYSIVFTILYKMEFEHSGIVAMIISVLYLFIVSLIFNLIEKNRTKRVEVFFKKCKEKGLINEKKEQ